MSLPWRMPCVGSWPSQKSFSMLLVARLGRLEGDEHDLGVSGPSAADLLVGGVGREPAGVADRGGVDAVGCQKIRSAPQKQPMPKIGHSTPSGKGPSAVCPAPRGARALTSPASAPGSARNGLHHRLLITAEDKRMILG